MFSDVSLDNYTVIPTQLNSLVKDGIIEFTSETNLVLAGDFESDLVNAVRVLVNGLLVDVEPVIEEGQIVVELDQALNDGDSVLFEIDHLNELMNPITLRSEVQTFDSNDLVFENPVDEDPVVPDSLLDQAFLGQLLERLTRLEEAVASLASRLLTLEASVEQLETVINNLENKLAEEGQNDLASIEEKLDQLVAENQAIKKLLEELLKEKEVMTPTVVNDDAKVHPPVKTLVGQNHNLEKQRVNETIVGQETQYAYVQANSQLTEQSINCEITERKT